VDYHRNSNHPVVARFLGWKHQPKLSENRQLDPCFDRYRRHPHRFETIGDRRILDPRFASKQEGQPERLPLRSQYREQISNEITLAFLKENTDEEM
jgi:hypothetical protein